jgi:hypothetical protein
MKEAKRGDRVSLNSQKRLYYFQTNGGITLIAEKEEMAIIPQTATDDHLKQINHALKAGQLVLGWPEKKLEMPDKDSDIKSMLEAGRNKIDDWLVDLREDKSIKNVVKIEKLEKIIEFEKFGKNRKSVLKLAETILNKIGGVSPVIESDQQKLEIKLTSGTQDQPDTE